MLFSVVFIGLFVASLSSSFKFLSYNTHLFGGTVIPQKDKDEERRNRICQLILDEGYDVVALQEVWSDEFKKDLIECINSTLSHSLFVETPFYDMGSGLLLLSRFPVLNHSFAPYKHLAGWDKMSQKGALSSTLQLDSGAVVSLVMTQTQADIPHRTERYENFAVLHEHSLTVLQNPQVSLVIVAGDMNFGLSPHYQEEYKYYLSLFSEFDDSFGGFPDWIDPTVDPQHNEMAVKYDGKSYTPERDDVIMVSKGSKWRVLDHGIIYDWKLGPEYHTLDLSDHFPIFAVFELD